MKRILLSFFLLMGIGTLVQANHSELTKDFKVGDPGIQSINAMTFGPEGILFLGDSKTASIIAIDTKDNTPAEAPKEFSMKQVDELLALQLGTTAREINIKDMAVNPVSKMVYFAVQHSNGTPVLLKTDGKSFTPVPLNSISHSILTLSNPVAADAEDRRGRSLRVWAISDLNYYDGKILVTGLSNEEFSSTFRSIDFPFSAAQSHTSLEIYHAAHGRYETYAPIKTFLPIEINGQAQLLASFTCTPLVLFPMSEMKRGQHTKGKTIAELGNWNTPLDIIQMEKEGKSYILMANSSRALMKLKVDDIANYQDFLTEKVAERSATAGVNFIALPFVNVLQLDNFGADTFLMLQRKSNGDLNLLTQSKRWL